MSFINIVTLVGGLAIFIFGVDLISTGIKTLAGARLRKLMRVVVRHRWSGLIIGLIVTFLLQSSSASTVLFVSLVQGGLLAFKDTIALILGAMVGTTLTVQVIAFNISDYALIPITVGVAIHLFSRHERSRYWAYSFMGIGFIFYGMAVMKMGVMPLRNSPEFTHWFKMTIGTPWLSFLIAMVFTAVVQASAATMALLFSFASVGLLGAETSEIVVNSLPFVFGANVGTTITALLASINSSRAAMRCAVAHTLLKTAGAVTCMFLIGPLSRMTLAISSGLSIEHTLANSHTLFNILNVLVYLPFTRPLGALFTRMIPDTREMVLFPELKITSTTDLDMKTEYHKSRDSLVKCLRLIRQTLGSLNRQYQSLDWNRLEDIAMQDELLNRGYREVRNHAVMLYRLASDTHVKTLFADTIRIVELIERLGDDFSRSLIRILRKLLSENLILSVGSVAELEALNHRFSGIIDELSLELIDSEDFDQEKLNEHIAAVDQKLTAMRRSHFQSLADNVPAAVASSSYYLDILSEMESSIAKIKTIAKLVQEDRF